MPLKLLLGLRSNRLASRFVDGEIPTEKQIWVFLSEAVSGLVNALFHVARFLNRKRVCQKHFFRSVPHCDFQLQCHLNPPFSREDCTDDTGYQYNGYTSLSFGTGFYTQILRKSWIISGTQEEVDEAGKVQKRKYQKAKKGVEIRKDTEYRHGYRKRLSRERQSGHARRLPDLFPDWNQPVARPDERGCL